MLVLEIALDCILLESPMEIKEDLPNESKQRLLLRVSWRKGVSHHHLHLAETPVEQRERFTVGKGEGSGGPAGGYCPQEAVGRLTRSGASYMVSSGFIFGFSGWTSDRSRGKS